MSTKDWGHSPVIFVTEETNIITDIYWTLKQNLSTGHLFWDVVIFSSAVFFAWLIWTLIRNTQKLRRRYKALLASGFNSHYALHSTTVFAIDRDRRELAVVYPGATFRYRFDQIHEWRYEWDTRNGVRINNRVIINVLDPDHPRHVATNASTHQCEQWHARMNALLNMTTA